MNVVLSGHEHVYQRVKPQHGIYYLVLGNAGDFDTITYARHRKWRRDLIKTAALC